MMMPTRCNVIQYSLLLSVLYMFQAVSPPIIRSSKTVCTASGICQACLLLPLAVHSCQTPTTHIIEPSHIITINYTSSLPDDGSYVIRNMLEYYNVSFRLFYNIDFNIYDFYNWVHISWLIKVTDNNDVRWKTEIGTMSHLPSGQISALADNSVLPSYELLLCCQRDPDLMGIEAHSPVLGSHCIKLITVLVCNMVSCCL